MSKVAVAAASSALLLFSLAGCSSGTSTETPETDTDVVEEVIEESPEGEGTQVLPPQIVDPEELQGASFEVTAEQPLVINADDPAEWTGTTTDTTVAVFVPGSDDGTTVFNPGFEAVGPGETVASVTSPDGDTYDFTITVP